MKRNYFIAIAVAALLVASTIAQAADVSFSGQFRPRFEIQNDAHEDTNGRNFFSTRVRLNATANVNANTSAFIQLQSNGEWGNAGLNANNSSDRDSSIGNDVLNDVGFHQAFLTYKGLFGHAVDAKIGRQEVVLDGHRLFGHTGWTQGAQTNDAIRLNHSAGNHELNYIYIAGNEAGSINSNTDRNRNFHVLRGATQGVLGGNLVGMFVVVNDASADDQSSSDQEWYTIGARQSGKIAGLDYRVEYYHQFGDAGIDAVSADHTGAYATAPTLTVHDIDRDASMFGIRLGKTFTSNRFSPTITLWYDSLSGTDDDDISGNDYGAFNTLQDTGHKYYGLIDNFTEARGNGTQRMGLQDIAIKSKWNLNAKNILKVDFHQFLTHTDLTDGDSDTIRTGSTSGAFIAAESGAGELGNDLGQEIDVTLVHKYDSNTKLVAGYSHYFTTLSHGFLNGSGGAQVQGDNISRGNSDGQNWVYLMVDTKF